MEAPAAIGDRPSAEGSSLPQDPADPIAEPSELPTLHSERVVSEEGEAGAHPEDEAGSPKVDDSVAGTEHHHAEHLPEEPVFDGTEKMVAAGNAQGDAEGLPRDLPDSAGNAETSRFGAFDFARKGVDWPEKATALKNFVKERGVEVSNVIRRLSGKMEDFGLVSDKDAKGSSSPDGSKETGEKKVWSPTSFRRNFAEDADNPKANDPLQSDSEGPKMRGRITLFSMSGCEDSRAVRSLLRKRGLRFVEVNVDVFPQRRLELEERTGTSSVPQVFFNESFVGGIDELNALEATHELDERLKEVFENECPATAPLAPVYGEDEPQSGKFDEFAEVVRKLRERVQIKDRFHKMRWFSKCFVGSEAVDFLAEDQYCERDEAVEFGKRIAAKHFFRNVLQENVFEDGNHLYRFLEHDPVISMKCFNFSGLTNDMEPWSAAEIETSLRKFTHAIIDSYVSDDGKHIDYHSISISEEFRRYVKMTEELHRVNLDLLSRTEKLALFINLYNMMAIHAIIVLGHPTGPLDRRRMLGDFQYVVGGYPYSLSAIQNGILRGNQRPPYNIIKPFGPKDQRLQVALPEVEPLIHFGLTCASRSSPAIRCYCPDDVDADLRANIRAFFREGGVVIDKETQTVSLSKILKWFKTDFGKTDKDMLAWIVNYLENFKAEDMLFLLDGMKIKVVYQPYDWSLNL